MSTLITRSRVCGFALVLFAAVLWLPLGQQGFLVGQWVKVGTMMAPMILLTGLSGANNERNLLTDPRTASVIMLFAYLVHQFEEHWVDLLGEVYPFHAKINAVLHSVLGQASSQVDILTPEALFVINTSLVWMVGAIAIWRGSKVLFPSLAMAATMLVNAITHIAPALFQWSYNPGLLTAVCLFLPLSIVYSRGTLQRNPDSKKMIAASIAWAIGAHALLIGGSIMSTYVPIIPVPAFYGALIMWSILPAFLFRSQPPNPIVLPGHPAQAGRRFTG